MNGINVAEFITHPKAPCAVKVEMKRTPIRDKQGNVLAVLVEPQSGENIADAIASRGKWLEQRMREQEQGKSPTVDLSPKREPFTSIGAEFDSHSDSLAANVAERARAPFYEWLEEENQRIKQKSPTVDLSPKPKARISLAVDRFTENVDNTRAAMAGFCEAMMQANAAEVLPRRAGWLARWRERRALRRQCRARETVEAALRRLLEARNEQIGVLKKRVTDLLQKLDDEHSHCATLCVAVSDLWQKNEQVTDAAFRINEERSALEVTAEHFAARFHALTAENARLREELALSEAARLDVIGGGVPA